MNILRMFVLGIENPIMLISHGDFRNRGTRGGSENPPKCKLYRGFWELVRSGIHVALIQKGVRIAVREIPSRGTLHFRTLKTPSESEGFPQIRETLTLVPSLEWIYPDLWVICGLEPNQGRLLQWCVLIQPLL
jgi:hypothetical protein